MEKITYRFECKECISRDDMEDLLVFTFIAIDSLHGSHAARIDWCLLPGKKERSIEIDGSTAVGRDAVSILTGFLVELFGEESFEVTRNTVPKGEKETIAAIECGEGSVAVGGS